MSIWVFLYHAQYLSGSHEYIPPGPIAVDIFMFISGLLMAYNYRRREELEPWNSTSTWKLFYIRRFFRIAPLYYVFIAYSFLLQGEYSNWQQHIRVAFPLPWQDMMSRDPSQASLSIPNILSHFSFLYGFFPQFCSNNLLPDWSLSLEMQFYVVFPILMLLLRRIGYGVFILLSTIIFFTTTHLISFNITSAPHVFGLFPQPSILPAKINCFLVGVVISEAYFWRAERECLFLIAAAIALSFFGQNTWFGFAVTISTFLMFGNTYLVQSGLIKLFRMLNFVLSNRLAKHLGSISFGIYLSHMVVIIPMANLLLTNSVYMALPEIARWSILVTLSTLPIYFVSLLGNIFIEGPFISYSRKLTATKRTLSRPE